MKKTFVRILILGIIVSLIFCPAVSARNTADGLEKIEIGDIVFLGEDNLDFSSFSRNGNLVDSLRTGLDQASIILLTNQIGNIPSNTATGLYYAFNNTVGQLDYVSFCTVKNPADYVFGLEVPPSLHTGDTEEIILTGKPYETYYLSISPDAGPKFSDDGSYSKQIIMNTAGKETFQIIVPDTAEQGTYTISVRDSDGKVISKSVTLTLKSTQVTVTLDEFSLDMLNGKFAVGDLMKITAHIIPAPDDLKQPLYGFVTGPNLPVNGANFEGKAVVDGKTETFTKITYSILSDAWEYYWDTSGFEPGMYTLYVSYSPIGHVEGSKVGNIVSASQEISLSDKSIHVKFAEENGGIFTQGDVMYSYWSARGSPNAVRWYIIGPNFLETGVEKGFPLYTPEQEKGKDAPQGLYGFSYPRTFSNSMAAGNYYLVYQHPGFNREFDVMPNVNEGHFTSLTTNFGESASLDGRPSSNCAEALETLINSVRSDDLCVISEITLEEPEITIDQVDHLEIGDKLKIKGTTNYAGEGVTADGTEVKNTFSLIVNRLDFDLAEENAAMKLQIVNRVVPQNVIPYYGERTYAFDEIDTATWFEGTYQATVTNIDTGFSESIMFTVGGEGVEQDSATLQVPSDPLAEPYEELDPLPPIIDYSEPVEPEEPKSPGFLLTPLALAAAFALRRK